MASPKKRGSSKSASPRPGAAPVRIFVRVGALKRFHKLKQKTAELPVEVSWDRRKGDRRTSPGPGEADQRDRDRRQKPPFTWEVADFVVVEEPPPPLQPREPKRRRKST